MEQTDTEQRKSCLNVIYSLINFIYKRWNNSCVFICVSVKRNIYILNVASLDETIIPGCLHFSMQNIEQSTGLGRTSRWSNVNVNQ